MTTEDVGGEHPPEAACDHTQPTPDEVDAVMTAARVLVAVTAQSVAAVEDRVTLPQLRVLVMIASREPQNLNAVAQALGVHSSNATRACDKLVEARLLHRSEDPADRRNVILRLTESGQQLIRTVMDTRRAAIASILAKMRVQQRSSLVPPLRAFADAAGEIFHSQTWALSWTTTDPPSTHQDDRQSNPHRPHTECGCSPQ
jgi:DNA-binding MarR family transcriptional regulator